MENPDTRKSWILWRRGSESNRRTRLCRPLHDHSATPPLLRKLLGKLLNQTRKGAQSLHAVPPDAGAGKEARTPDLNLGKVALYQLSYSRVIGR